MSSPKRTVLTIGSYQSEGFNLSIVGTFTKIFEVKYGCQSISNTLFTTKREIHFSFVSTSVLNVTLSKIKEN